MANYPYYPQNYPQNFQNFSQNYQQSFPQNFPQTQQIQNGGFLPVRSRQEAMGYPVAPGTSVTFKDESAPYIYTKTKGFNQFDEPVFDVYKLTKEEDVSVSASEPHTDSFESKMDNLPTYALKSEFDALQELVSTLAEDVDVLKSKRQPAKKKEVVADE